jgi:hypothetical protein
MGPDERLGARAGLSKDGEKMTKSLIRPFGGETNGR